jgi:phosphomannomutase/phosphoglucomutase
VQALFAGQRRLSGLTTTSLVNCFEADTQNALPSIQEQFRQLMKKIKPDIALLF